MKKIIIMLSVLFALLFLTSCGSSPTFDDQYDYKVTNTMKLGSQTYQYQYVSDFKIQIKPKEDVKNVTSYALKLSIFDGSSDAFSEEVVTRFYNVDSSSNIDIDIKNIYLNNVLPEYKLIAVDSIGEDFTKDFQLTVKVRFDTQGGNQMESLNVSLGEKATKPNNPNKIGFIFSGWYLGNELYDFNSPINDDITLTALWKPSSVTVLTNADFIEYFTISISKTYYKEFNGFTNAVFYDIIITKKYDFTIRNTFNLSVSVVNENSNWTYFTNTIKVSDFDSPGYVTYGPTSFVVDFDFNQYTIKIGVTNLG